MSSIEEDKRKAAKKLKELAFSRSDINDMVFDFSISGLKKIKVPKQYGYEEPEIFISGKFYKLYKEFLRFLESEKYLEYMVGNQKEKSFVESEFDRFVIDIFLDAKYRDGKELNRRIQKLLDSIYKLLELYKVIIPIKYFDTKTPHSFEIKDSVVIKFDMDLIKKDAIAAHPDYEHIMKRWDEFITSYCIIVNEKGNNRTLVIERARKKASIYLNYLRLYAYKIDYKTFAAMYFTISDASYVYNSKGEFIGSYYGHNDKKPLHDILNEECVNKIYDSLTELKKLNQIENPKTKERIERTIYWLGKAITEVDLDISLILYCTALESLLIPEIEGKKGELLTLRVALIEKKMYNGIISPLLMFNIYEIRSNVVHGTEHEISRENFITNLEIFISRILFPFIEFASNNPQMKPTKLMTNLESFEDILEVFFLLFRFSDKFNNSTKLMNYILNEKLLRTGNSSGERYIEITNSVVKKNKEIPSEVLTKFFQACRSNNFSVRRSAVFTLGLIEEISAADIIRDILLNDDDIRVREYAALALGRINDKKSASLEVLIQILGDENTVIRKASAKALGWIMDPTATKALIESLKDKEAEVRAASARSLGIIRDERAFKHLLEALEDDDPEVINSASISLGTFKDRNAIEPLKVAKRRKIYGTQETIDWALNEINE